MNIIIEEIVSEYPVIITEEVVEIKISDTTSYFDLLEVKDNNFTGKDTYVPTVDETSGKLILKPIGAISGGIVSVNEVGGDVNGNVSLDADNIPETATRFWLTNIFKTAIEDYISWITTYGESLVNHLTDYSNPHRTNLQKATDGVRNNETTNPIIVKTLYGETTDSVSVELIDDGGQGNLLLRNNNLEDKLSTIQGADGGYQNNFKLPTRVIENTYIFAMTDDINADNADALKRDGSNANSDVDLGANNIYVNELNLLDNSAGGYGNIKIVDRQFIFLDSLGNLSASFAPEGLYFGLNSWASLRTDVLTTNRNYTLPDKTGTFAMLDDVTGITDAPNDANAYVRSALGWVIGYTKSAIDNLLSALVPTSRTINSKALSSDITLVTDDIAESGTPTNKWWTNARTIGSVLTGLSASSGTFVDTDSILVAFGKIKYFIDNISTTYQVILTNVNFGAFIMGLISKTSLYDGDYAIFSDVLDSNIAKRVSAVNIYNYLKNKFNSVYTTTTAVATQISTALSGYATQSYVDSSISSAVVGLLNDRGNFTPSGNYPSTGGSGTSGAIKKGDIFTISGLGSGVSAVMGSKIVTDGDVVRALVNTPAQTDTNWAIGENNFGYVAENLNNKTSTITGNETSTTLYSNIKGIVDYFTSTKIKSILGITTLSGSNTGNETLTSIANINHSATAKTTLVDADEITGQDSSSSFSLIRFTALNLYNYLKGKFDSVYTTTSAVATQITTALSGYATQTYVNSQGFLTTITSSQIGTALGFTPYKYVTTSQTNVVNTTLETIIATATIPGGTFNANDVMKLLFKTTKTVTTTNATIRIKINTSNTLSGAVQIATYTFTTANLYAKLKRDFDLSGGNINGYSATSSAITDDATFSAAQSSNTYNPANTLYVFFTVQLGTALLTESITLNLANITN